jgi:hypothetical protein
MRTPSPGGEQSIVGLALDLLAGWLLVIDTHRCRQEIRPALIRYRRGCYQELAAHWQPKPAELDSFDRNVYIKEQRAAALFILSFLPDDRIALNELEPKGIYVHINELAAQLPEQQDHPPPSPRSSRRLPSE